MIRREGWSNKMICWMPRLRYLTSASLNWITSKLGMCWRGWTKQRFRSLLFLFRRSLTDLSKARRKSSKSCRTKLQLPLCWSKTYLQISKFGSPIRMHHLRYSSHTYLAMSLMMTKIRINSSLALCLIRHQIQRTSLFRYSFLTSTKNRVKRGIQTHILTHLSYLSRATSSISHQVNILSKGTGYTSQFSQRTQMWGSESWLGSSKTTVLLERTARHIHQWIEAMMEMEAHLNIREPLSSVALIWTN